jgi:hypothetical protein
MLRTPSIKFENGVFHVDGKPLSKIERVEVGIELKSFIMDVHDNLTVTLRDEMFLIPYEMPIKDLLALGFYVKLHKGQYV